MRVCVVRAAGRTSVGANAGSVEPGFNVAALPDAAANTFGVALGGVVSAFGELRPVERQAAADKPFAEIGAAGRTGRDRSTVLVQVHGHAVDRTPSNEGIQIICGPRAAPVL